MSCRKKLLLIISVLGAEVIQRSQQGQKSIVRMAGVLPGVSVQLLVVDRLQVRELSLDGVLS